MKQNSRIRHTLAVQVTLALGVASRLTGATLSIEDISSNAIVEDFEGVLGSPGVTIEVDGYGAPPTGFTFQSGLTLVHPDPNNINNIIIEDTSVGSVIHGTYNGQIDSATHIPSGTAYLAFNTVEEPMRFSVPEGTFRFGAFVAGGIETRPVLLNVYDSQFNLLASASIGDSPVNAWSDQFIGVEAPGISFAELVTTSYAAIDDVTFEIVPEPSSGILACGSVTLFLLMRRRAHQRII